MEERVLSLESYLKTTS